MGRYYCIGEYGCTARFFFFFRHCDSLLFLCIFFSHTNNLHILHTTSINHPIDLNFEFPVCDLIGLLDPYAPTLVSLRTWSGLADFASIPHVVALSKPLQKHVKRPTAACFDEEISLISVIYPDRVRVFFIYSDWWRLITHINHRTASLLVA